MRTEDKMLTEDLCKKIEADLINNLNPRRVAAYLCLHLGLTVAEATALRYSDVDWDTEEARVSRNVLRANSAAGEQIDNTPMETPADCPRTIQMPHYIVRFLRAALSHYDLSRDFYWITGDTEVPNWHLLQSLCVSLKTQLKIGSTFTPAMLRDAFIRRCLVEGIDTFTIAKFVGMKQINEIQRRFGSFACYFPSNMNRLEKYELSNIDCCVPGFDNTLSARTMKMVVLGAGDHGQTVMETAAAKNVFDKLAFLDDNVSLSGVIGTCSGFLRFKDEYPLAFPAFGDNNLRMSWVATLERNGFIIPSLLDNSAIISTSAKIGNATIVEAKAVVSSLADIGRGCIVSANVTVDVGAKIGEGTYIAPGLTIPKRSIIPPMSKVEPSNIGQYQTVEE